MRPAFLLPLCLLVLCPAAWLRNSARLWAQTNAAKPDLVAGKKLFEQNCSVCHGLEGGGGRGPNLHTPKLKHASDEKSLRALIENGISPDMPAAWYLSEYENASVAAYVLTLGNIPREKVPGDPAHGAAVFAQSACNMCHTLGGQGTSMGPDLTDVGSRRGAAQLRLAIVHPEQAIPDGFLLVEAVPESGDVVRGIRLNEDSFSIQMRDLTGHFHSFSKAELKDLKKLRGVTPMPAYETALSPSELEDLVAYLAVQRGEP
jgi:cytochrome c oxidase cbb3-type subunit 3